MLHVLKAFLQAQSAS